MPGTTDHNQPLQPTRVAPEPSGCAKDADVTDAGVPLPPGLQAVRLSEKAAQAIQTIIDDETHPVSEGREMPTADASVLKKKP
jgi:hypothetical protein